MGWPESSELLFTSPGRPWLPSIATAKRHGHLFVTIDRWTGPNDRIWQDNGADIEPWELASHSLQYRVVFSETGLRCRFGTPLNVLFGNTKPANRGRCAYPMRALFSSPIRRWSHAQCALRFNDLFSSVLLSRSLACVSWWLFCFSIYTRFLRCWNHWGHRRMAQQRKWETKIQNTKYQGRHHLRLWHCAFPTQNGEKYTHAFNFSASFLWFNYSGKRFILMAS